jgi:hypothetical protein
MAILDQLQDLARRMDLEVTSVVAPDAHRDVLKCEWTARLLGVPSGVGGPGNPPVFPDLVHTILGTAKGDAAETKGGNGAKGGKGGKDAKDGKGGKVGSGGLPIDKVTEVLPGGDADGGDGGEDGGGGATGGTDTILDMATVEGEVRWTIRDDGGRAARDVRWRFGRDPHWRDGAPAETLGSLDDDLAFQLLGVLLYDADGGSAPTKSVTVQASVKLTSGTTSTGWIDLPARDVAVPALGLPTITVLFEHENFGDGREGQRRRALVVVPSNAAGRDEAGVAKAISLLNNALATSAAAAGPLRFLADATGTAAAYAFVGRTKVEARDEIDHMGIEIDHWDLVNWFHAEDNISSLILIGAPGRQLQFFNARRFDPSEGHMNVTVGPEGAVLIRNLASANPASEPPGRVEVVHAPAKARHKNENPDHKITTFGDEVSSIRLGWGPVPDLDAPVPAGASKRR